MSQRYKITLSYDGTPYFGWQKTRMGPSIQETLQQAVLQIAGEKVLPEGASRTDRGVHAAAQVASIDLEKEWDPRSLQRALNAVLPREIRIGTVEQAENGFHPTLEAKEKEYRYRLCLGVQDPIHRLYSWAFRFPLDLDRMRREAHYFLGAKDFSAFANEPKENPVCKIRSIEILPLEYERLEMAITGDRFLYKMMRNIVGTLLYVGCGKLPEGAVPSIFASKDRTRAGVTAPAHGLILYRVHYLE